MAKWKFCAPGMRGTAPGKGKVTTSPVDSENLEAGFVTWVKGGELDGKEVFSPTFKEAKVVHQEIWKRLC